MEDWEALYAERPPADEESRLIAALDAALERRDAAFIGQAYTMDLRRRLREIGAGVVRERDGPVDMWLMIVWDGERPREGGTIDLDLWLDLVVAAAEATTDSDEAWCIADGPACHLIHEDEALMGRLQALRPTHRGVDALFRAYQADLRSRDHELGWWGDDHVKG